MGKPSSDEKDDKKENPNRGEGSRVSKDDLNKSEEMCPVHKCSVHDCGCK
jgi:hypothetical protein